MAVEEDDPKLGWGRAYVGTGVAAVEAADEEDEAGRFVGTLGEVFWERELPASLF